MAKSQGIRKTLEQLIKKVETLENQSFDQKLQIDELEGKLASAEEKVKKLTEDPYGLSKLINIPVNIPYVNIPATPVPQQQVNWPGLMQSIPNYHVCTPSTPDWSGSTYCTICGAHMSGATWSVYSDTNGTTLSLADPTTQSSSDVEPTLDLDISWVIPDEESTT